MGEPFPTMGEPFRVVIAGAGLMGAWHARYARQCGASVCGVLDRDPAAADRLARQFAGARPFTELGRVFEDCRPRVVHVCTPMESHAVLAAAALDAGAHVLVEKPLAETAAISRELLSQATKTGLLLSPVHQFLFQQGFIDACAAVPRLGRILHLEATFCSAGGERATGASLDEIASEILTHPLGLIERLVPGALDDMQWQTHRTLPGEWRVAGATHALTASVLVSLQGRPTECSFRILTDGGVIDLDLFHGFATIDTAPISKAAKIGRPFRVSSKRMQRAGSNLTCRLITREFAYPGLRRLISEFYKAARSGSGAPIGAEEIIAVAAARDHLIECFSNRVKTVS
jgi:predicted dehydrogenase